MDYSKLQDEAKELLLSDEAQELVSDISENFPDPTEAAIIGFSCGMLFVKHFVDGVITHE